MVLNRRYCSAYMRRSAVLGNLCNQEVSLPQLDVDAMKVVNCTAHVKLTKYVYHLVTVTLETVQ